MATICPVTDDLSGHHGPPPGRPDFPHEALPAASHHPVAPPVTPPPPGTPPPGEPEIGGPGRWRLRHALLAFLAGFVVTQVIVTVMGLVWAEAAGSEFTKLSDDGSFVLAASAVNSLMLVTASWVVVGMLGAPRLGDFGLLRAPFWRTVGKMAVVMASYVVLLAVYAELVKLAPDSAPDKLGAATSNLHMLAFVVLVAVLAPVAEEFFFRGLLYRALANSVGVAGGAVVSGLLFGAMHIDSLASERLLQVVPLAILGIAFALLYHWSGTLYAPIALHATNNSMAAASYAVKHDSDFGLVLAAVVWVLMMLLCTLGPRLTDRASRRDALAYSVR